MAPHLSARGSSAMSTDEKNIPHIDGAPSEQCDRDTGVSRAGGIFKSVRETLKLVGSCEAVERAASTPKTCR
jgi:hypothetical protein